MSWADQVRSALSDAAAPSAPKIAKLKLLTDDLAKRAEDNNDKAAQTALAQIFPLVVEIVGDTAPLAREFASVFVKILEPLSNETIVPIGKQIFSFLHSKSAYYTREVYDFGYLLAEIFQAENDLYSAVQFLNQIELDKPQITDLDKVKVCLLATEFYLAMQDIVNANKFIKKIHRTVGPQTPLEFNLRYQAAYARILDSERRFLESSRRYIDLSQLLPSEKDRLLSLEKAVTCAILAKAGSSRSRLLGMLYNDERSSQLKNYKILGIMHNSRIVRADDEKKFEDMLTDSQNVTVEGGLTVLKRAVFEHNMLAVSSLYSNISLDELGTLLGTSPARAEAIACKMIEEGRLKATIDQLDNYIDFTIESSPLYTWDSQVQELCLSLNDIYEGLHRS